MKKVLFIAYHFPPLAGGGTFRSLKFVKYLPEFGWLPTVLTTNTKNYLAYDETLLNEVPENVKIIRAGEYDPFYLHILLSKIGLEKLYQKIKDRFLIPDEKIGWIPLAYRKAVRELKKYKYDLIFSTSPTPCAHIIALKLRKKFGIPWICDFRDFWTDHPYYRFINTHRGNQEIALEKKIISTAELIITAFNKIRLSWRYTYQEINDNKFYTIYNGYDSQIYNVKENKNKKLNLLYTGSFYGKYNPRVFFDVLLSVYKTNQNFRKHVSIKLIGNIDPEIRNQTVENVEYLPYTSPTRLNEYIENSDVLLLVLPVESGLPGKIFTYMATLKPIFAIVPDGETKEILKKTKLAYLADPDSVTEITNQLLNIYTLWKANKLNPRANTDYIQQFQRRNQVKQLSKIFNRIV